MNDAKLMEQAQRWRAAYGPKPPERPFGIVIDEATLLSAGPWPSLYASDFIVYIETQDLDPRLAKYCRDMNREMIWAYGGWANALHKGDASRLMIDLINAARGGGGDGAEKAAAFYGPILRFLTDYAKANNISLGEADEAGWESLLGGAEPLLPPGQVEVA